MEKRKNGPIRWLFVVLLVIFMIGMLCEVALKVINIALSMRMVRFEFVFKQTLHAFGEEAIPLWMIPTTLLKWMLIMPREVGLFALRWLPYLILFLLPVFCALFRKRAIPLIVCAAVSGVTAIGIVLVRLLYPSPMVHVWTAIPFGIETLMLVLACIALGTKSKGFSIVLGVCCVLLALLSPMVSAAIAGLRIGNPPAGYPVWQFLQVQARRLPLSAAVSYWPIFKAFAFLMYGLILFAAPSRFPKRVKA